MTETDIQNQIRIALSKYGIVIRLHSGNYELKDGRRIVCGVKGLSDLLFIGSERVAFIEVKNINGKASEEQLNFLAAVRKLGHRAGIAHSVEEALEIIK
ncbi:MAG: VRR-NUC domain-containing protein [Bacteroides sp.]|nr:VRR-NUC domain-containing protein [Bacteroides sp.]